MHHTNSMKSSLSSHLLRGALAGLSGTVAIWACEKFSARWAPTTAAPLRGDPEHFMVERAEAMLPDTMRRALPPAVEEAMAQSLAIGYGTTWGVLYGALRPQARFPVMEGLLFGTAVWGLGYVGWLQQLGFLPPLKDQAPREVAGPIVQHAVYGVVTAKVCNWLNRRD